MIVLIYHIMINNQLDLSVYSEHSYSRVHYLHININHFYTKHFFKKEKIMKSNISKLFAVTLAAAFSLSAAAAPTTELTMVSNGTYAQSGVDREIQYPQCGLDCQSH